MRWTADYGEELVELLNEVTDVVRRTTFTIDLYLHHRVGVGCRALSHSGRAKAWVTADAPRTAIISDRLVSKKPIVGTTSQSDESVHSSIRALPHRRWPIVWLSDWLSDRYEQGVGRRIARFS